MQSVGRPRTFDREEALNKAMLVFWEKGYEGTSMSEIIQAIGTKAPSIYAAFGNKDSIFKEAVNLYLKTVIKKQIVLLHETSNVIEATKLSLNSFVKQFTSKDNPHTCLVMTAAVNASPEHQEHVMYLKKIRQEFKNNWKSRFEKAKKEGQLNNKLNPQQLADYFVTIIQGMALSAKDGATKKELLKTTELAMSVFYQNNT